MMRLTVLLALSLTARQAAAAQARPSCRLVATPAEIYEAAAFEVEAAYDLPASAGRVKLHCEVKGSTDTVLLAEVAEVAGRGTHRFRLLAPSRRVTRRLVVALWMGDDWRRALSPIQFSAPIPVYPQEAQRMNEALRKATPALLRSLGHTRSARGNVAVLADAAFGADPALAEKLADAIRRPADGAPAVSLIDAAMLANPFLLHRDHFDLLVLTDARVISAGALRAVHRFLRAGGSLAAIGTPAFQRTVRRVGDKWLDADQIRRLLWDTEPKRLLFDFEEGDVKGWTRASNTPKSPSVFEVARGGKSGRCLRARIPNLTGWDGIKSPELEAPFPKGHTLTCFWAKGTARTTELAIEYVEADGSRWIATVPLTARWLHYALPPEEFRYWQDSRSKGRGGPGDGFKPANARALGFTLAFTHTHVSPGEHAFWVDEVGTAPNPHAELTAATAEKPDAAVLGTLSPAYKFYPITNGKRIAVSPRQALIPDARVPWPKTPRSSHVRPQATGCDKGRKWRWVPLIETTDGHTRRCGFPATLLIHARAQYAGGAWAALSYTPAEVAQSAALRSALGALARRMLDGLWLLEGGAQWYTCFHDQTVTLGATAANFGRGEARVAVTVRVIPSKGGRGAFEKRETATLKPGQRHTLRAEWNPDGFPNAPHRVETILERDGQVIDRLSHELHCWRPRQKPTFMTTKGLDFIVDGKPWVPHGVNYMPSSGVAIEDGTYFERWLGAFPYDPDVIQTDLERVVDAGLNTVSIFVYYQSIESGNLLDILRRCEALGLKVNLSLRPGTPLDFRWDEMRAIIERYRLASNDTVFVYDLAWEPMFRNHAARRPHDAAWAQWIAERYGSIEAAEKDWKHPCPRDGGTITNPSDKQVSADGPWRVMVAAYRRFLDDLLAEHYARARRLVRGVDPNHLVSFRMTIAGDPTISHGWSLPYDFRATAAGVDVVEPEGYGRIGDWDRVRPGAFTVAYARCVAPNRPCMWAEFGRHVWDRRRSRPDPELIDWTAKYYERFYKMALMSEASGTVCWWYPGGFRVGENSDYGIVNPDGSDRPITEVIRRHAQAFAAPRTRSATRHWITIDRDAHPGGLPAIYGRVSEEFWAAMDRGDFPGLRHDGQGTTSVDCPLVAVGNVPYTGGNPPKHLNALFARIQLEAPDGRWLDALAGGELRVAPGRPIRARVVATNTGFATWISPRGRESATGCVHLTARVGARPPALHPLTADAPYLSDGDFGTVDLLPAIDRPATITLELVAKDRMRLGPRVALRLRPVPAAAPRQ